jgi:protein-L-isoaspartate(D-aspartate) O-methyltransferase
MDRVSEAFGAVPRANFTPTGSKEAAGWDMPLSIGHGQTISQPTTVRMMLEWLDAQPGSSVLDVGSGSGWSTALLAYLVGPKGFVYAVERVPQLLDFGRHNVDRLGVKNAKFFPAANTYGLPQHAPYDRILVSASAQKLPNELLEQLKPGGKLVIPVQYDILEITKITPTEHKTETHPGFAFVPLI